ncbi:hypothetical protein KAR91_70555 [Candidatus Pacearchaeota archaeon]|nr:hypothetical protein [Candidatus Pacearchaeota archaeon]
MKTAKRIIEVLKEMFTFSDDNIVYGIRISNIILIVVANYQVIADSDWQFMIVLNTLYVGLFTLGYFSRKPDPNRKGFKKWLKVCILRLRIAILKKSLKPYTTLNKIKHRKHKGLRDIVKAWRIELKDLKSELNEIVI